MDPQTLKYAKSDEWVFLDGNIATVGISDRAEIFRRMTTDPELRSGFVAWREAVATPEVEEDVRGLRDQDVAVLQEGWGKRRMLSTRSVHQPLHRRHGYRKTGSWPGPQGTSRAAQCDHLAADAATPGARSNETIAAIFQD